MSAVRKLVPNSPLTAGGILGALTAVITSALVYFVPAWHSGIPPYIATIIPAALTILGVIGGQILHRKVMAVELAAPPNGKQAETGPPSGGHSSPSGGGP